MWYAARLGGSGQEIALFATDKQWTSGMSHRFRMVTGRPGADNLSFERPFNPANADVYSVGLYCGPVHVPAPPDPCTADHATPFEVRGMEVRLSEDKPPTVHQPAGTLLARGPQRGVRALSYSASDSHSGLARADVLLGDTVVTSHDLTPRCSYSDFTVCPTSDDETLEVDTRLGACQRGGGASSERVQDHVVMAIAVRTGEQTGRPRCSVWMSLWQSTTSCGSGASRGVGAGVRGPIYFDFGRPGVDPVVLVKCSWLLRSGGSGGRCVGISCGWRRSICRSGDSLANGLTDSCRITRRSVTRSACVSRIRRCCAVVHAGSPELPRRRLVDGSRFDRRRDPCEADAALKSLRAEPQVILGDGDGGGRRARARGGGRAARAGSRCAQVGPDTEAHSVQRETAVSRSDPDAKLRKPGHRPHLVYRAQVRRSTPPQG